MSELPQWEYNVLTFRALAQREKERSWVVSGIYREPRLPLVEKWQGYWLMFSHNHFPPLAYLLHPIYKRSRTFFQFFYVRNHLQFALSLSMKKLTTLTEKGTLYQTRIISSWNELRQNWTEKPKGSRAMNQTDKDNFKNNRQSFYDFFFNWQANAYLWRTKTCVAKSK